MPFKIIAEDENLICTDFIFRKNKIVKIKYEDIGKLEGGIFEKKLNWLMKIHDRRNNLFIGFFQQLKGSKTLETIILNKITGKVYNSVSCKMGLTENPGRFQN